MILALFLLFSANFSGEGACRWLDHKVQSCSWP